MTFEQRLSALEKPFKLPGTSLSRCFLENGDVGWVIGIGPMGLPKKFAYGRTIDEVLTEAEKGHFSMTLNEALQETK